MKWSGVTWGVPVAPGSQLAGCVPAAAEEVTAVAKPGATGNATAAHTADAKASSPPQVTPVDLLKAVGVGALAFGGIAGVAYLLNRSEQRERQALEQDIRERRAALERENSARQQLERFIEDTVEAAAARHFGQARERIEAGEKGRDLRARSREQERDTRATEAERRRDARSVERDRRAAEAERERDRRAAEAAGQRDRKSAATEASRAGSAASAWAQQQRELQQRADAQLAAYDVKMQELKDQLLALARPPAPAPSPAAAPGSVTDRLRKLYDDD